MATLEQQWRYNRKNPWIAFLHRARRRCQDKNRRSYKYYMGIKCLLTVPQIRDLWFRDKAVDMEWASLDRLDPKKDYTMENCRFIEQRENSRNAARTVLTEAMVLELRAEYARGQHSMNELARQRGLCGRTVAMAIRGVTWKHLRRGV